MEKSEWSYDKALQFRQYEMQEAVRASNTYETRLQREVRGLRKGVKRPTQQDIISGNVRRWKRILDMWEKRIGNDHAVLAKQEHALTESSHPILLGPATIDSLINQVPDRLDYIKEGRFPFNNVFFEFMEPLPEMLPGFGLECKLCGVQLNKKDPAISLADGKKRENYDSAFYFTVGEGKFATARMTIWQEYQTIMKGIIRNPIFGEILMYLSDKKPEETDYGLNLATHCKEAIPCSVMNSLNPRDDLRRRFRQIKADRSHIKDSDQKVKERLLRLNCLAINLINYVNSQNVSVRKSTRQKKGMILAGNRGKIEHEPEKPYHLVGIDSLEVVDNDCGGSTGALEWRVYVRGHVRRYRDKGGSIRKTTWVHPHIRGPENAPWKHHRYAVLAGMLEREKEMLIKYSGKNT